MTEKYLPVVGLEIHVELKTRSKMFCGCKNDPFHAPKPNIYTCPVCLGLPGALPVPNKKAVEWTILIGLALNCKINTFSKFDRKNYFYPDLPKGYQISQYDQPLCTKGWLEIKSEIQNQKSESNSKKIRITRVHLEEDTGKLLHAKVDGKNVSLIDFNRSGVPLIEIVTEPDIHSSEEAKIFLKKLHQVIRYLDISDAEMEKGSMRLEPNISVTLKVKGKGEEVKYNLPAYKVEVKNINSFNFVKKAIDYEVSRQIEILERGDTPVQETRGWDEKKNVTLPQRRKEEASDYRYFPEPDIPPMRWTESQITELKNQIPEMPDTKLARFSKQYFINIKDAVRLTDSRELADYFDIGIKNNALRIRKSSITAQEIANWILNKKIDIQKISFSDLISRIAQNKTTISVDSTQLNLIISQIINNNQKAVADYKSGKINVIMFLVGLVMKELKGKGDPQIIRSHLEKKLL